MIEKIEGLNINFDSENPSEFVEVLDQIALSSKDVVMNLGTLSDITKVTCYSEIVAISCEDIITTSTKGYESPGSFARKTNDAIKPLDISLEILVNGDEINEELLDDIDIEDNTSFPNDWNEEDVCKHNIILGGTLQNHTCDKKENCKTCHGSGHCQECNGYGTFRCGICEGRGRVKCNDCGGTGTCRRCRGGGQIRCTRCGGKGSYYNQAFRQYLDCEQCKGTGYMSCPDCNGLFSKPGRCGQCNGTGEVRCKRCKGGHFTCTHCKGTGHCTDCSGTGKIVCSRCNGTGFYQTFFVCTSILHQISNTYISTDFFKNSQPLGSEDSIKEILQFADGNIVFNDVYCKLSELNQLEINRYKEVKTKVEQSFRHNNNICPRFEQHLVSVKKKLDDIGIPYKSHICIREIPIVKIDYTINECDYSFVVIGKNSYVLANDVPQCIKVYKENVIIKILKYFTRKKRIKSYIKLAAYIFQRNNVNIDEVRVIQVLVKYLKLKKAKEEQFISSLSAYGRNMPYSVFRNEIKSLFVSKKTLTFAWQCMAVDKTLSEGENELFDLLCKECHVTDVLEIEKLKKFATKFATLADDTIVNNYIS